MIPGPPESTIDSSPLFIVSSSDDILSSIALPVKRGGDRSLSLTLCFSIFDSIYLPFQVGLPPPSAYSSTQDIVPLVASKVALPDSLQNLPILKLLPNRLAIPYRSTSSLILSEPEIHQRLIAANLRRPRVLADRQQYISLVQRMLDLGMLSLTATPKCVNGLFGTPKGETAIRLILDARYANCYFCDPPHVVLPSPSHLAGLAVPDGSHLWVAKMDLSNFYHQFLLPVLMQTYFALPHLSHSELTSLNTSQLSPELQSLLRSGVSLYPCCATLPMGWSHSVFVAQSIHEHVLYSSGVLHPTDNITNLSSPYIDRTLHALYIDDCVLLSNNEHQSSAVFSSILSAYRSVGLPSNSKKCSPPSSAVTTVLGIDVNGASGVLSLSMERTVSMLSMTNALLSQSQVSGLQLSTLLGHWTWCMLLRRPSLAVLKHAYTFAQRFQLQPHRLWPSVRRELLVLVALLPLLHTSLISPRWPKLIATDSSSTGAGVVSTPLSDSLFGRVWSVISQPDHSLLPSQVVSDSPSVSDCGPWTPTISSLLQPVQQHRKDNTDVDAHKHAFCVSMSKCRWSTIIASPWHHQQHINMLELHSVILAVRWVLSHPSSASQRLYLLTDSSSVYYGVNKGRSTSPHMLSLHRRLSCLLLSSANYLSLAWIPSELNPADKPSRKYSDSRAFPDLT
jgi:hypothetical protein